MTRGPRVWRVSGVAVAAALGLALVAASGRGRADAPPGVTGVEVLATLAAVRGIPVPDGPGAAGALCLSPDTLADLRRAGRAPVPPVLAVRAALESGACRPVSAGAAGDLVRLDPSLLVADPAQFRELVAAPGRTNVFATGLWGAYRARRPLGN